MSTTVVRRPHRSHADDHHVGIHVEGLDDVMARLAQCCTPVPGDEIMGFITRGRGVSVHRVDCANAASLAAEQATRLIDVEWDRATSGQVYVAGVEVVALDRTRLLRDVANSLGEQGVNIVSCETVTGDDRVAKMRFGIELSTPAQLSSVINTIKRIDGVYDAHRIVPGASNSD
jgi:GTP pyrophosphokinase